MGTWFLNKTTGFDPSVEKGALRKIAKDYLEHSLLPLQLYTSGVMHRIKAELDELKRYEDEVKTVIEEHVRTTINKAIAGYLSIEKNFKAMYAAAENYKQVKMNYNMGKSTIAQLLDAQQTFLDSKLAALNSQYVFFKELVWVQRALCSINWKNSIRRMSIT